ncbi:extracellular protein, partial [Phytophthora palmivora]
MPFAKFCQDRYDALIEALEDSNAELVESKSTVEELEEKLDRVSKLREAYDELQVTSKSTILCLEDEIDTLKRQVQNLQAQLAALTSHPDLGSPPPTALARLLFNQDQELIAARQRDQSQGQSLLEVRQGLKDRDQDLSTDEIDTLKRQVQNLQAQLAALTSHPDLGSPPPTALARLLFNQDQELIAARQRDQTQDQSLLEVRQHLKDRDQELSTAQQRCQALERSEASLEAAALQLQRQVSAQDRRITRLQEERDQFRADYHEAQSERDQAVAKTNSTSERLDKARAELRVRGNHVDSMRANISRLEQQVADLQTARSQVDHQFVSQKRELAALRVEHAALSAHYQDAYSRFWAVARSLNQDVALPTPASLTRPRSGSESSPTRSRKTRRLDLSSSHSPDDLPDSEGLDPDVPEPELPDLPQESEIEQEDGSPEQEGGSLDLPQGSEIEREDGSPEQESGSPEDDDADNPEMLAALAKSRSDLRRSKPSEADQGASGTASHPIDLGGEGSDNIPSDDLSEQSPEVDPPMGSPNSAPDDSDLESNA